MIKKEILNQLNENQREYFIRNIRELYFAVTDYFRFGLDDDMENIEVFGRPVLNHLKKIIQ